MGGIADVLELQALDCPAHVIRVPDQIDVPFTDRVKHLIDTASFRRLSEIPQLGLVALVYPGATHTRFEHSLGVYRNTLLFVRQLDRCGALTNVDQKQIESLLLAALFHDIGHWPFCHPIEDLGLDRIPSHETCAAEYIADGEISDLIQQEWETSPEEVIQLLAGEHSGPENKVLRSILSGPIDVDKMDYLYRDSLHAGVPYGRNFDAPRLIGSLVLNGSSDGIAITTKGRTAAELMVFARYVMFSEVYWHHAVRSATAMFQRAFYEWYVEGSGVADNLWMHDTPSELVDRIGNAESPNASRQLTVGLFGPRRLLHKRWVSFSCFDHEEAYRLIAQNPYPWLVQCGNHLGTLLSKELGIEIEPHEILIDAPPVGLEVQFDVQVRNPERSGFRPLGEISPVVSALATRQFDDFVKQVRVFTSRRLSEPLKQLDGVDWLLKAASRIN
ncbi:MAG: HD domain-containing protein [Mariniblastus sp.]|nr:HD domain-containing protein [Mariniblastus sp.]